MAEPRAAPFGPPPHALSPEPEPQTESEADRKSLAERAAYQVAATWLDTRTEQALLGAILLKPDQLQVVKPWLRDADFFGAHHQLIFRTINGLISAQPDLTYEELSINLYERVAPYGIDGIYLHTLMRACPQPNNAVAYGHMIVQADARRAVARYTYRLAQTIEVVQDRRAELDDVLEAATHIRHVAGQLKARTLSHSEPTNVQLPTGPTRAPSPERIKLDERLLVRLINSPHDIPEVAPLLNPSDFATPVASRLYDLLLSMHDSGTPIDILTVMWNARRAQILDAGDASSEDFFRRFDKLPLGIAVVLAAEIQDAATLEHAVTVATTLTAALADHRVSTAAILHLATTQVDELQQRHHRDSTAYQPPGDPAPASPSAQAASRI